MAIPVTAQQLRNNLGEYLDRAFYKREVFTVTRAGREKAVLLSFTQYQELAARNGEPVRERDEPARAPKPEKARAR